MELVAPLARPVIKRKPIRARDNAEVGDRFTWGQFEGTVTRATNRRVQEVRLAPHKEDPPTKKAEHKDREK